MKCDIASSTKIITLSDALKKDGVSLRQQAYEAGLRIGDIYTMRSLGMRTKYVEKLIKAADYYCVSIDYLVGRE